MEAATTDRPTSTAGRGLEGDVIDIDQAPDADVCGRNLNSCHDQTLANERRPGLLEDPPVSRSTASSSVVAPVTASRWCARSRTSAEGVYDGLSPGAGRPPRRRSRGRAPLRPDVDAPVLPYSEADYAAHWL